MKKISIFLFFINLCLYAVVTFEKTFGGTGDDEAYSVKQTSDGGYIIAGYKTDSLYGTWDMCLQKIDSYGNQEWDKIIGCLNTGYSVIESDDGGFVIAGITHVPGCTSIYIEKTDAEGNRKWYYEWPGSEGGGGWCPYDIIQTSDNGYAITGTIGIIKLDSDGKEELRNESFDSEGRSIIQTEDKGFLFTGFNDEYLILVKTDSLGNKEWEKNYGGLASVGFSVKQALDGGFVIFGKTGQMYYADMAWLIKTDANGEMEWDKQYGSLGSNFPDYTGQSLDILPEGGYILAGYSDIYETAEAWLIKTDSEGNEIWEKTYGGAGDDRAYSVQQTADGGYILAGYTDSFGAGGKDMWIIKTDENGTEIESPFLPQTTELHQNYPNPFNPVTEISYSLKSEGMVTLSVFNTKGELVSSLVNGMKTAGNHSVNFNGEGLNSGIYFYKLSVDGKVVQSRKMIMLK